MDGDIPKKRTSTSSFSNLPSSSLVGLNPTTIEIIKTIIEDDYQEEEEYEYESTSEEGRFK